MPDSIRIFWLAGLGLVLATGAARGQGKGLDWQPYGAAVEAAQLQQRPVLVYVHADGCGWCYRMERDVFAVDSVKAFLARHFVLTRLDFGDEAAYYRAGGRALSPAALARHLGAAATPTLLFLDPGGRPVLRLASYVDARGLHSVLAYVASGAYRRQPFEAYRGAGR